MSERTLATSIDHELRAERRRAVERLASLERELAALEGAFFLFRWVNADLIASLRARVTAARGFVDGVTHARAATQDTVDRRH